MFYSFQQFVLTIYIPYNYNFGIEISRKIFSKYTMTIGTSIIKQVAPEIHVNCLSLRLFPKRYLPIYLNFPQSRKSRTTSRDQPGTKRCSVTEETNVFCMVSTFWARGSEI